MAHTISRTEQLDPRTLLVDVNVRSDVQLDKQFVGTIKDHGVLVPIVAVDTPDGIRVRFGHRRTLAAVEAGLDTVPVIVVQPDSDDLDSDAAEIDRLVTQHVENTHRTGLTTAEEIGVAGQLAAFGLSVNQIARRTRTKKAHVEKAVAAAESELAAKATQRYDLTLEQAATLAEFDDDPDTVKTLVAAAKDGQFDHVAQRARDDRAQIAAYDETVQRVSEQGITVVAEPEWDDPKVRDIRHLLHDDDKLTPEGHAGCPGGAAYVRGGRDWDCDEWTAEVVEVCTDYTAHGHTAPADEWRTTTSTSKRKPVGEMTDDEREQAREQRRFVIAHNKAWTSATEVRRLWLAEWLTRKTPPKGTAVFVAGMIAAHPDLLPDIDGNHLAA
ncbi:MAG: ParB/RepB/Spo0J family partition protein, partial [Micromonosporaceae bacterium]